MSSPRSNSSDGGGGGGGGGSGGGVFRLPRLAAMDMELRSVSPPSAAPDSSARSTSAHFEAAARRASVTYRPDYAMAPKLSPMGLGGLPPLGGRSERSAFFQDMPPQRAPQGGDLVTSPSAARSSDRQPPAEGSLRQHRGPTLPEPLSTHFKRPSDEAAFGATRLPPLYSRTTAPDSHLPAHSPHRTSPSRPPRAAPTHPSALEHNREEAFGTERVTRPPGPVHSHSQPHISGTHLHIASSSYPPAAASSAGPVAVPLSGRKPGKQHVPSACLNCKRAHLACDVGRPCRRCVNLGKSDTCVDVVQKKRGRPRLKDRKAATGSPLPATGHQPVASASTQLRQPSGAVGPAHLAPESAFVGMHREAAPPHQSFRRYSEAGEMEPWPAAAARSAPSPAWARRESIDGHEAMQAPRPMPPQMQTSHGRGRSWSSAAVLPHGAEPTHHAYDAPYAPAAAPAPEPVRQTPTVSLICSTELQCVRASEECTTLLGLRPEELQQLSLFDLVHPTEGPQLEDLWQSLIRPVGIRPSGAPAHAAVILNAPPAQLLLPAAGTVFVENTFRVRLRSGTFDFYSVRLHLGGYFGADLFLPETLGRAYVVASLLKLGNDATHPSIAVLRNAAQDEMHERSPVFRTPVGFSEPAAARERATPRAAYGQQHYDEVQQRSNVSTHTSASHSVSPRESLPSRQAMASPIAAPQASAKRSNFGDALPPSAKRQRSAVGARLTHVPRYVDEGVPC